MPGLWLQLCGVAGTRSQMWPRHLLVHKAAAVMWIQCTSPNKLYISALWNTPDELLSLVFAAACVWDSTYVIDDGADGNATVLWRARMNNINVRWTFSLQRLNNGPAFSWETTSCFDLQILDPGAFPFNGGEKKYLWCLCFSLWQAPCVKVRAGIYHAPPVVQSTFDPGNHPTSAPVGFVRMGGGCTLLKG